MMEYLAHSKKGDFPAQTYADHVKGVRKRAERYASELDVYSLKGSRALLHAVRNGADFHDMGKLDDQNQEVLHNKSKAKHLPVNHVDAGTEELIRRNYLYSAVAVYSHHRGLPDMAEEEVKGEAAFRDANPMVRAYVDESLPELVRCHEALIAAEKSMEETEYEGDQGVFFRLLLSCLADADHSDTAASYGQVPKCEKIPALRAEERLAALDQYVNGLGGEGARSMLRREMYTACRNAEIGSSFTACDSPVGSGKTTAVMAHLLRQASIRKARRIFVILPYTNIITQSVDVYRKALVLPGEDPEAVVGELHCRADFQSEDIRYLTALWRAPIVVTTAVAFFETLASNQPAALRRLHELPASVIFIDESHNALPQRLLPLAWHWMNVLANEWCCYWVLASGSLVRFWKLNAFREQQLEQPVVSDLVSETLRQALLQYEHNRISFRWRASPIGYMELIEWIEKFPGPRLVILNTVQSAAVVAEALCCKYGRTRVEHLSTALTAEDRAIAISRIQKRLDDPSDQDWTLVATSCVEAGVDFSFRTGFREISSLLSLLQTAGRVSRHGDFMGAEVWSFSLQDDSMLKENPGVRTSREILIQYFKKEMAIAPELSTQSMNDEIVRDDSCLKKVRRLLSAEDAMSFRTVEEQFKVIDSNTVTAIVDKEFAEEITFGKGDWRELQKKAISIRKEKVQAWELKEIKKGIYQWTLGYDSFLGYMRGVLASEHLKQDTLIW